MKINKQFVKELHSTYGSRFLKLHSNGMWLEISAADAHDKVGHAIRFALRRHLAEAKPATACGDLRSSTSSSTCSSCGPIGQSETTNSEDGTTTAVAATAASTTSAMNDSEPPSPTCDSVNPLNVNQLLAEPLYLDEYDSGRRLLD
jgi:hypothetical protein